MSTTLGWLGSAAAISWIGLAATSIAWVRNERGKRKVRMLGATHSVGAFYETHDGVEVVGPEVRFYVFNGTTRDVGLHDLYLEMHRHKEKPTTYPAPIEGVLPESVRAQHSVVIRLNARALGDLRWSPGYQVPPTGKEAPPLIDRYRLELRLGNGQMLRTLWTELPDPHRASTVTNTDSDF
jgi:hypothetical protein